MCSGGNSSVTAPASGAACANATAPTLEQNTGARADDAPTYSPPPDDPRAPLDTPGNRATPEPLLFHHRTGQGAVRPPATRPTRHGNAVPTLPPPATLAERRPPGASDPFYPPTAHGTQRPVGPGTYPRTRLPVHPLARPPTTLSRQLLSCSRLPAALLKILPGSRQAAATQTAPRYRTHPEAAAGSVNQTDAEPRPALTRLTPSSPPNSNHL